MTLRQVLERKLGKAEVSGNELIFACPKCSRKKLGINTVKKLFNCFRCKWGGHLSEIFPQIEEYASPITEVRKVTSMPDLRLLEPQHVTGALLTYLTKRGILPHRALELGVCYSTSFKQRNRVFIPVGDAWVGRAINDEYPKELFFGTRPKGEFLYQTDPMSEVDVIVVTEGIFDAENVRNAGYKAVALMGSSISAYQVGSLAKRKPYRILIMLDQDDVGKESSWKVMDAISRRCDCSKAVVRWENEQWKDPGEMPYWEIKKLLDSYV